MQLLTQLVAMTIAVAVEVTADIIAPKTMIISMFAPEAQAWYTNFDQSGLGNLTAVAVPSRGLSMLFPSVFCTEDAAACHLTVGEGEINAAASAMALLLSPAFDLRRTYFLLSGIAGVNPDRATLGAVAFARYAVQVGLQYEVDPRSAPEEWEAGYVAYGRDRPHQYPSLAYGTEVFELNAELRDAAYEFATAAVLEDDEGAQTLRRQYNADTAAAQAPGLVKCDVTTSDVYFIGEKLADTFDKTTEIWTNGTGEYCMSAQEDNAILEVLVRGAVDKLIDFSRVILMRAGSNFDRPPPGMSIRDFMAEAATQPGQAIASQNIYNAGVRVVRGIVRGWHSTFASGVSPQNYVGDILGSLGGVPDFGTPSLRLEAQRSDAGSHTQKRKTEWMTDSQTIDESAQSTPTQRQERQRRRVWQLRRAATVANAKM
ncbi:hypothetical protein PWT90_02530 [Aphanocladium album]|nr:hypothetical protein PWT90_02530 [Aphanocladium album]